MAKKNIQSFNEKVELAEAALKQAKQARDEYIHSKYIELGKLVEKDANLSGENKTVEELIPIWKNKINTKKSQQHPQQTNGQHNHQ